MLSDINPEYSREFSDILQRMTSRERYGRPESWHEVIQKLKELEVKNEDFYKEQEEASIPDDRIFLKKGGQENTEDLQKETTVSEDVQELKPAIPKSRVEREKRQRELLKAGRKAGNKKMHWLLYLLIIFTACIVSLVSLVKYYGPKKQERPKENTNNLQESKEKPVIENEKYKQDRRDDR